MKNKRTLFIMAGMLIFCAFAVVRPDEVRALLSFYGPRTGEPAGEETWRFREKESAAAGTYFLFEPEGAEERRLPLVVVLHGAPGNAYAAAYLSRPRLQTEYPSFILIPTAAWNMRWAGPADEGKLPAVIALVEELKRDYAVDPSRVYIIGCSNGGAGVFGAVLRYPETFAAAVAVSGAWDPSDGREMTGVPLMVMNGAEDEVIPPRYGREIAARAAAAGGDATYLEFQGVGHQCPSDIFYPDTMWAWMFAKARGAAG